VCVLGQVCCLVLSSSATVRRPFETMDDLRDTTSRVYTYLATPLFDSNRLWHITLEMCSNQGTGNRSGKQTR
jgi:hypothetical protein